MNEPPPVHDTVFSSEQLNKRFYNQFKSEHALALGQLHGVVNNDDATAYITTLLLRLIVLYFLQGQGLLDNDPDYLFNRLQRVRQWSGPDCFYREYLLPLFNALYTGQPIALAQKIGLGHLPHVEIPLFQPDPLELRSPLLLIEDAMFFRLFDFFSSYQWQLDHQLEPQKDTLQPSILAYIFEQHSDQKQTGTYYTQEDIALYITGYTILPRLLLKIAEDLPETFGEHASCWQLLKTQPERYIHQTVCTTAYLPEETEREYQQRKVRYHDVLDRLKTGSIHNIVDLITYNLNLQRFTTDILMNIQEPAFLLLFLKNLKQITILDPTCGSGAFLLAAMQLLQPLYTLCLERLDVLVTTSINQQDACLSIIIEERQQQQYHPTRQHYILTLIAQHNLYGVDLAPEAINICRLRLYLARLASIKHIEDIQPWSTLTFNIHTGNALVGTIWNADLDTHATITAPTQPTIEHSQQHSFHWQQTFPEVFSAGGFDVIVGNPPYLEYSKIKGEYTIDGYEEKSCGNIYAAIIERSLALCRPYHSQLGLIVPISLCGSQRFTALRQLLVEKHSALWLANFEIFPCRLFEGAFQRLSILLASQQAQPVPPTLHVTRIHRWYSAERPYLLSLLHYTQVQQLQLYLPLVFPKLASSQQELILQQLQQVANKKTIGITMCDQPTEYYVYYQEATNYWAKAVCHVPFYKKNGQVMNPPHGRFLFFADQQTAQNVMAILNSSLFYLWFATFADGFHLSHALVKNFPLNQDLLCSPELGILAQRLEQDILVHARLSTRNTQHKEPTSKSGHMIELTEYYMRHSKPILDDIDRVLATYYRFNPHDLDFVLHYDEKHRLTGPRKKHKGQSSISNILYK
ncbi:hypothetical protein KDA_02090 [Dictyobacter alpinus]|uniref:site-specific DNA-methyltransferase (adenine-specific) n=1 Tax=Dictyobacter alpinus TaxID=2014873 RepID=A0A402B050_9CHLR|nr:DNA methyltransferase [Dictyobacter alpinus]GCE24725.1 hypothetical protein KDA_02090 [Dictyobacter alpinus]